MGSTFLSGAALILFEAVKVPGEMRARSPQSSFFLHEQPIFLIQNKSRNARKIMRKAESSKLLEHRITFNPTIVTMRKPGVRFMAAHLNGRHMDIG